MIIMVIHKVGVDAWRAAETNFKGTIISKNSYEVFVI